MKAKEIDLKLYAEEIIKEKAVRPISSKLFGFGKYDGVGLTWNRFTYENHERVDIPVSMMEILDIEVIVHRSDKDNEISYMVKIKPYHESEVYIQITGTAEQAFAVKDALDDMVKAFQLGIEYHVVAVSQCEELEPSETIGVFDTELQAIDFKTENAEKYWTLTIEKYCSRCHESLEYCHCDQSGGEGIG